MAELSWPAPTYNSGAVNNIEYEQLCMWQGAGMLGLYTETPAIFADSSGRQVKIRASRYGVIHGYHWYSGASDVIVALAANASGSTRVDRIVLRLDRSTWTVRVAVIAGTPGAGAPAYTQSYGTTGVFEISLATVTVINGASTIAPADLTFTGMYFATPPMISTANGDPATQNNSGRTIFGGPFWDPASGTLRFHNGTSIRTLVDGPAVAGAGYGDTVQPPLCKLILNANFGVANNTNAPTVPFGSGSEAIKTHAALHNTVTNNTRIVANIAGYWEFTIATVYAPNTTGFRTHSVGKNGARQATENGIYNSAALPVGANIPLPIVTVILSMAVNDYCELFTFQNSGGTLNVVGDGNPANTGNTSFTGRYLRPL